MVNLVAFSALYLIISNWVQAWYLIKNYLKPKRTVQSVDGKGLLPTLKKKTGLDLIIKVMPEKKKLVGFMVSSPPFKPRMVFSEKLYEMLNKDEFEWVALHEAGHYLMWHNLKLALSNMVILAIGLAAVHFLSFSVAPSILLAILLALIHIQVGKIFEYQADRFAAKKITNPKGMITGNQKMKKENKMRNKLWLIKLLYIAVPHDKRIEIAEEELKRRP